MAIGTNITASSFANFVKNQKDELGQNAWTKIYNTYSAPVTQAYETLMRGYKSQADVLTQDYNEAIGKAYDTFVANKRFAQSSDYGTGDVAAINEAYRKAYDKTREEYRRDYDAGLSEIGADISEATTSYNESITNIVNALAKEQETLATNYAAFFNSKIDYLDYLWSEHGDIFNEETSYFSSLKEYINEDTGTFDRDTLLGVLSTQKDGGRVLTEDALQLMQAINSFDAYAKATYDGYDNLQSFADYLYEQNPELAEYMYENDGAVANEFYSRLGLDNPYDTKFLSEWLPENTYGDVIYEKDGEQTIEKQIEYSTKGLWTGAQGDNFRITVNGETYKLEVGKHIKDEQLIRALNRQATGSVDTTPIVPKGDEMETGSGGIQMYNDKMYVYTRKHGWSEIRGRTKWSADQLSKLVDSWKYAATGKPSSAITGLKVDNSDFAGTKYGIDDRVNPLMISVGGTEYRAGKVEKSISSKLSSIYGLSKNDIVTLDGKFYTRITVSGGYNNLGSGKTEWVQLRNFKG